LRGEGREKESGTRGYETGIHVNILPMFPFAL
jgi:hypothetical protein